jgi:hypothetical protein
MPSDAQNLPRLMAVGHALGPLRERVVFVGGAVVNLYTTMASGTPEPRITDDVDCIVEFTPRTAFYQLAEELRTLSFVNDVASGTSIRKQSSTTTRASYRKLRRGSKGVRCSSNR